MANEKTGLVGVVEKAPLAPLVRGVEAMRPTRGWKKSPPEKGAPLGGLLP